MNFIAADVGGTSTRLVYANSSEPENVLYQAQYASSEFDSFEPLLKTFINDSGSAPKKLDILTLALPGQVSESSAKLTNLPWTIEKQSLKDKFGITKVHFINDFQASALGTCQISESDRVMLNHGGGLKENSTRVAVGAGTGLGLSWVQGSGESIEAHPTEGGHIDFAPVDETQIALLQFLLKRYPHVSYERLLSGSGLVNIYEFCAGRECPGTSAEWVSQHVTTDEAADRAMSLFVQIYGAYIGNVALLFQPYGGIYITGGIAAKIVTKMQSEDFINAYLNKGRMRALVEKVAVYLVIDERIGVLGAMSEALKIQRELK